jgi:large subunit ribosomal protein L10
LRWRLWGRGCKLNRSEKEQVVEELRGDFSRAKAVVFTNYRGLTVAEISALRKLLREGNFEYKVVKNTLAKIAAEGTSVSVAKESFSGPVGVAIGYADPVLTVKKVLEYAKKNDKLKVGVGLVEGSLCDAAELRSVAELPSREVLLSILAGCFQSPLSKFGSLLNASLSSVLNAMEALRKKKEGS